MSQLQVEIVPLDLRYGEPFESHHWRIPGRYAKNRPSKKAAKAAMELEFCRIAAEHHPELANLTQTDFERCCNLARKSLSIGDAIDLAYDCLQNPTSDPEGDGPKIGRPRKANPKVNLLTLKEEKEAALRYRKRIQIEARMKQLCAKLDAERAKQNKLVIKLMGARGKSTRRRYPALCKHYQARLNECEVNIRYALNELTECKTAIATLGMRRNGAY